LIAGPVKEGYRFEKQGFALEKVQARSYTVLRNLIALATASWALSAENRHQAEELIEKGRRLKKKRPKFVFYSFLMGWQLLFSAAKVMFYDRLRRSRSPGNLPQLILPYQATGL